MYSYVSSYGGGIYLAPCLQRLCWELQHSEKYGPHLINDGEIGDTTHKAQGFASDHNPFIRHVTRTGQTRYLIRAIDLGGPTELLLELRLKLAKMYADGDPRLFGFGYLKGPDSKITNWTGMPMHKVGFHTDTGDEGHLHISVTQKDGYNPSPSGWVPALGSRKPWGITSGGHIAHRRHVTAEQAGSTFRARKHKVARP